MVGMRRTLRFLIVSFVLRGTGLFLIVVLSKLRDKLLPLRIPSTESENTFLFPWRTGGLQIRQPGDLGFGNLQISSVSGIEIF